MLFITSCNKYDDIQNCFNETITSFSSKYDLDAITNDLEFITNDGTYLYKWESSNENVISNTGKVTRQETTTYVVIVVTIYDEKISYSEDINCTVLGTTTNIYTYDLVGVKSYYSINELEQVDENGHYFEHEDVIAYIFYFKKLPSNYLTKSEARQLGWNGSGSNVWVNQNLMNRYIGGDTFNNYEKLLPIVEGNTYIEVDVNCVNGARGKYRLVYNRYTFDIYYTTDHYNSFTYMIGAL